MRLLAGSRAAGTVIVVLSVAIVAMVLVSFAVLSYPYLPTSGYTTSMASIERALSDLSFLSVNAEQSIPAWFSSSLLLACALLMFGLSRGDERGGMVRFALPLRVLAVIFVVLSVDEAVGFHERTVSTLREAIGGSGLFYYTWVVPAIVIVGVVGGFYVRFVIALPSRIRGLMIAAAVLYVGGAVGMEMLGALHAEENGQENLPFVALASVEELLEMAGLALLLYTLMSLTDQARVGGEPAAGYANTRPRTVT